ncbi:MAG: glycosyltransferase [Bacteroidia bacterium]|nr:glycosyltransferase [Bacteroidia bacterium]
MEKENFKIVFLYTELAGYTLSCLNHLSITGAEIMVFRYPVNKEAPFQFKENSKINFFDRKNLTQPEIIKMISEFKAQIIVCSGWIDKEYVKICRHFKKLNVKTVLCLDNQWRFSVKQLLAVMASPFLIKPGFKFAWVPGKSQRKFVSKLGIKKENIFEGFYCADTVSWTLMFDKFSSSKENKFPRKFIYIGRYYEFKGLEELWKAFSDFSAEFPDWELWCLGTGDLVPAEHPKIKHFGFVQPADLEKFVGETGVFVLPSRFEPWGVVVHEMVAAGFPLILSNEVGARETFLQEGENGFVFEKENVQQLTGIFRKMALKTDKELLQMGTKSNELSQKITLSSWVETISKMINV